LESGIIIINIFLFPTKTTIFTPYYILKIKDTSENYAKCLTFLIELQIQEKK